MLWNELSSSAPEWARRQTETARTNVDFSVALLYGNAVVATTAFASLGAAHADHPVLILTGACLVALIPIWYHAAVAATDEWAAAVRALVNLGRKPLAEALGRVLPRELEDERATRQLVTRMSRRPYAPLPECFGQTLPCRAAQRSVACLTEMPTLTPGLLIRLRGPSGGSCVVRLLAAGGRPPPRSVAAGRRRPRGSMLPGPSAAEDHWR